MIYPDQKYYAVKRMNTRGGGGGDGRRNKTNSRSLSISTNMGKYPQYILRWKKRKSQNYTFSVVPLVYKQVTCTVHHVYVYT